MKKSLKLFLCFFLIGFFLISCKKENTEVTHSKFYIDSFTYEIKQNKYSATNEFSYSISFTMEISANADSLVRDFEVRIMGLQNLRFFLDKANTEHVENSSSETLPYVYLQYSVPKETNRINVDVKINLFTKDLIEDINKFIRIRCVNDYRVSFEDNHHYVTENGDFILQYSSKQEKFYIDSFTCEVKEDESSVPNELSYSLSFTIGISVDKDSTVRDFYVKIQGKKDVQFSIDRANTENVDLSNSYRPTASLHYIISEETNHILVDAKIKITTTDLMDDINNFIEIQCDNEYDNAMYVDNHQYLTEEGNFKITYSSIHTQIYYEYDELREAYTVMSVISTEKKITIPAVYKDHPVKEINEKALQSVYELEELILPDSLINIPYGLVSGFSKIKSLTIPFVGASKTETENTHFGYIFGAKDYKSNSKRISSSLKEVIITGGTSIRENAFYNCEYITNITIPDSVTGVGENAFEGCDNLSFKEYENAYYLGNLNHPYNVLIKAKETSIDSTTIHSDTKIIYSNAYNTCKSLRSIVIPNHVISIGNRAFEKCNSLESVIIGNSVTSIGESAFSGCSSLTNIKIPGSVVSIGQSALRDCNNLVSITIPFVGVGSTEPENTHFGYIFGASEYKYNSDFVPRYLEEIIINGGTSIDSYAFYGCKNLTSITMPTSITSIGEYAFSNCSSLTSITIPNGITHIARGMFSNCGSLTSITIPDSVTSIEERAFSGCKNLTSITMPTSITSIGEYAFSDCRNLESIIIPASVTNIKSSAFNDCSKLTNVYYEGGLADWCDISFNSASSNPMYYASHFYLRNKNNEWEEVTNIEIPNTITTIEKYQFYAFNNVTTITIPDSVSTIGEIAFSNCSSLTNITIPNGITHIARGMFSGCSSLTSIKIPGSVVSIGEIVFSWCSNLTSLTIGEGLLSIGYEAFRDCCKLVEIYNLSKLDITKGSSDNGGVGYYAKAIHNSLDDASILIEKDNFIFYKDENNKYYLVSYKGLETKSVLPSDINGYSYAIFSYAFRNCRSLTSITIPDGVTGIGENAFEGCENLSSVTIGNGVTSIGENAFAYCENLTNIIIPNHVTSIGDQAFTNCSSLTSIIIPESVASMGDSPFWNCGKVTIYYEGTSLPSAWDQNWNFYRPIYYYSETVPTEEGNYWHYVDGIITKW